MHGEWDNLTAQNINFQVAQPTTPANYFHLLRRQMLRNFRKPMVIAAPKIGLKHPLAISDLSEFDLGTSFKPILESSYTNGSLAKKVILCSGKVGFDIQQRLEKSGVTNVKVVKVEEIAPFPVANLKNTLNHELNSADTEFFWVQEEPVNQGAF